mmetsp:Transcript_74610/g.172838  ORF Transcript_74610/g.172838 Transcript_74610/m.172838 type:complete len:103 (-) Transcript_74610:51-359(-)
MSLEEHGDYVCSAVFSPDGTKVLTACFDKLARMFDAKTGVCDRKFAEHTDAVNSAVFSADGSKVLTACDDGFARVFCRETGDCKRRYEVRAAVRTAVFAPEL